jgi:ubiquitin fusion degradation protein 1
MMKRLKLDEVEPIRLTGTTLPKGKLVKIQAQTPDFVEVSDPKAV